MSEDITKYRTKKDLEKCSDTKMVPIQFYVSAEDKKKLQMYCLDHDTKMTNVIKDAIHEYITDKKV